MTEANRRLSLYIGIYRVKFRKTFGLAYHLKRAPGAGYSDEFGYLSQSDSDARLPKWIEKKVKHQALKIWTSAAIVAHFVIF